MKIFTLITASLIGLSVANMSIAAGSGNGSTKTCKSGEVYDKKKKKCVQAERASDEAIYQTAMALAYSGKYQDAINTMQFADNQNSAGILNYMGFAHRKLGMTEKAMAYYQQALAIDPNYILARSYMGQGMLTDGDLAGAKQQLTEIRQRGGAETWAYVMLENAINSGVTY